MELSALWDYRDSYAWMERATSLPPLVITVAVNGGIQGRESHPNLPETPDQIAEQAAEAYNAGASAIHIHGRDPGNLADCTNDAEVYREVNALVRERCPDIVINNTTGGGPTTTMEARFRCLEAMPEVASLNLGPDMSRFTIPARQSPLPHPHDALEVDDCLPFTYGLIEGLAAEMQQKGIKPEMEIFQPGQYWVSRDLIEKGLVTPPYLFQFIMGAQTSIFPTPENLLQMVRELPARSVFGVVGVGKFQWPLTTMSVLLGGHVRVGLEDNLYLSRGVKLQGNGEAVEKIVRIARELNRDVATPAQARDLYGIRAEPSRYGSAEMSVV